MKLNEKIHYYRAQARLSQEELAAQVGVSRQAVSKWELGEATPEVSKLVLLAKAFGVTTDELLSEEPPREEPPNEPQPENPGSPDCLNRTVGLLGRLTRRYGWLVGVYMALSGLVFTLFGGLGRFIFGQMLSTANDWMGSPGEWYGTEFPSSSPLEGVGAYTLILPTAIMAFGLVLLIVGIILAVVLYRKGRH